jgi:GNAT superfamily N-acetyltransferase
MSVIVANQFQIETLTKSHKRQLFSCGVASLDYYIQKQSRQDSGRHLSVTFVLNDKEKNRIAGYYTLSFTSITLNRIPQVLTKKLPQYPLLPATLIGRLAVDDNYQKQGLGETLLLDALYRTCQTSSEIASFAVVVDAIDDNAINFYKKYRFIAFSNHNNNLYLPMKTIAQMETVKSFV